VSAKWKYDDPRLNMSHEGACDMFNLGSSYFHFAYFNVHSLGLPCIICIMSNFLRI